MRKDWLHLLLLIKIGKLPIEKILLGMSSQLKHSRIPVKPWMEICLKNVAKGISSKILTMALEWKLINTDS